MESKNALSFKLIILAAGYGTRFGRNKLLEPYRDTTVLGSLLEKLFMLEQRLNRIADQSKDLNSKEDGVNKEVYKMDGKCGHTFEFILVTNQETFKGLTREIKWDTYFMHTATNDSIHQSGQKMKVIVNPKPDEGISYSIRLGLEASGGADVYGFLVADQLALSTKTIEAMIASYQARDKGILCAKHGETLGNPVFFHAKYVEELKQLKGDRGGKVVLKQHLDDVDYFEIEEGLELQDLDTKEDWIYFIKENEHANFKR